MRNSLTRRTWLYSPSVPGLDRGDIYVFSRAFSEDIPRRLTAPPAAGRVSPTPGPVAHHTS
jgi:hypothetical protein